MVVQLIKPVLAPMLIAQAKRLRRVALELPEPTGERYGVARSPDSGTALPAVSVIIAGDSSAAGVGAATQAEALAPQLADALAQRIGRDVRWHLFAQTGLTSAGVLALLREKSLPAADAAVVIVGVNDITNNVATGHALRARNRIVRLLQERTGVGHVLFPGLPAVERFPLLPQPLAWYGGAEARRSNSMQARWAAHPRRAAVVSHLPMDGFTHPQLMAEDGFHPSPVLYSMVAAHFAGHLALRITTLPGLTQGARIVATARQDQ
ncbi:MAG: SGNH/GDSL hydrolase family protein [Burkholderiales bacterium]